MRKWLAALPLFVALGASWVHFTGALAESSFRQIFLAASALWFVLALWAQREKKSGPAN